MNKTLPALPGKAPALPPGAFEIGYTAHDGTATTSRQSLQRHERSTLWFRLYRRGGRVILHHGHIRPVLIRDWSRSMDGIAATIWASQTTLPLEPRGRLSLAKSRARTGSRARHGRVPFVVDLARL